MKIIHFIVALIIILAGVRINVFAQPDSSCFLPVIENEPGADGPYGVIHESFQSPLWKHERVHVFHPQGFVGKCPVIFLLHTFGATAPQEYWSLIKHIVSKGNVVVFSPTRRVTFTINETRKYEIFFEGYISAVSHFSSIIDTTRIGFIGHGFGGGAVPALMLRAIRKCGWGASGAFMYIMSPWYMYSIDQRSLETFPDLVKIVVQIFSDDKINDPEIAADIFNSIAVPDSGKVFMVVASDTNGTLTIHADNNTSQTGDLAVPADNPLVYYGIFRTFDDLSGYTFNNDTSAKLRIFPQDQSMDCPMGSWGDDVSIRPMIATRNPQLFLKKSIYSNPWHSERNPRIEGSDLSKAQMLAQIYYRNAWPQYLKFLGKNIKRLFNKNILTESFENPIKSGYGAHGMFETVVETFVNPIDHSLNVYVFHPENVTAPLPTIFFMHGYLGKNPEKFELLIRQIVSKGYIVVYPTYAFFPRPDNSKNIVDKYDEINAGINKAIELYKKVIDTTRIGFFGQSFGASAIPSVAYRLLTQKNWGDSGSFMFLSAPWYVYELAQENLKQFPAHVNLVIQVYNDDRINDHEMAVDLFNNIGIPSTRKKYYTVYSDSSNGCVMNADHFTTYGVGCINGEQNLLDYYGVYKLFDALADYSFTGNTKGYEMSLDAGTQQQLYMGTWNNGRAVLPMEVTLNPQSYNPESQYMYTFNNPLNPRRKQ